ncbi:MAG TPA: endonuclease/exonuclease/phosphatase family protein [Rhodopila sp.]|nr:endonuclease/exonuclease/phosphatase family protein [Rhodopila sp.]
MMRFVVACLAAVLVSVQVHAAELKVATWNLDWLTTRATGDRELPADVTTRTDTDFNRLADYARDLKADVIAIEEVDGYAAASRLFPRDAYSIHFTRDHVVQRVGIVVRRGLHYDVNPDLTALSPHHLRSGADITLHLPGGDLRILAVHLKKGCRAAPLPRAHSRACLELKEQVPPLQDWIQARVQDHMPFLILGDFNRWMDGDDTFLESLTRIAPLLRATAGHSSPCWGGEHFIDHILAGGGAARWIVPDSLRVMVYRETGQEWRDRLSDHCPVSVRLYTPE